MGSDGAHQGIDAQRALETILGGKDPPGKDEEEMREQVRARILNAATPDGPSPETYGAAADAIAKAMLALLDKEPSAAVDADLYGRLPDGFDDWLGGATGFQVGWAVNCVRWLLEKEPVRNPALITI